MTDEEIIAGLSDAQKDALEWEWHSDGRTIRGLEKRGFATSGYGSNLTLTELGERIRTKLMEDNNAE